MAFPEVMIGAPITAGGAFASAPAGTRLPTDAKTPLAKEFTTRGLISEDGFTLTVDRSTEDLKVWGGETKRRLTTEYTETVTVTFMESANADTLKAIFGDENVQSAGGTVSVHHTAAAAPERVWAITMKDGTALRRLVIPRGQLFLTSDVQYVHTDAIKYEVEITCYADDEGKSIYEYLEEDAASGPVEAEEGGPGAA